ncbi:MAG TPA: hypothetical protein VLV89_01290 [Candidatus Acidoferrum sp.]|nr:hypothetical protein [Candidatus Acidoferrum sp.]
MKPGSTKFWLCVSALAIALPAKLVGVGAMQATPQAKVTRANELTIAGFRPGRDTLAAARKKIGKALLLNEDEPNRVFLWFDICDGKGLRIEADAHGVIQSLTLSTMAPKHECTGAPLIASQEAGNWKTGRGLSLGDSRKQVIALYGQPGSNGPSQEGGEPRELLYYAFDWAGSEVPQVMEISCDKATGRVVEIMLAFPSL